MRLCPRCATNCLRNAQGFNPHRRKAKNIFFMWLRQWNAPKSGLNAHFSGLFLSKAPVVPRTGKAWTFHRKIKIPFGKMRVRLDSCAAMPKGDHFKMANDNNSLAYNNMELLVSYRVRYQCRRKIFYGEHRKLGKSCENYVIGKEYTL